MGRDGRVTEYSTNTNARSVQWKQKWIIDYEKNISFISSKDIFGSRSISIPRKSKNRLIDNYVNDISTLEIDNFESIFKN